MPKIRIFFQFSYIAKLISTIQIKKSDMAENHTAILKLLIIITNN